MRFIKPLRIFTFSLLATITLIVVSSFILSAFYEKAIVRYMQKYLDEHLLTELSVKEIKLRVLKGFPNATVEISNPVLLSGKDFNAHEFPGGYADTLLEAKSVSFQFDLLKLFNKQYELKKIEISQGRINILFDKKNRYNLNIWKSGVAAAGKDHPVNLKSILLNSTHINITSLHNQLNVTAFSRRTTFRGNYTGSTLSGETRGSLVLDSISVKNTRLIKNASLHLAIKMAYGGSRFRISQGRFNLNKAVANITGEYTGGRENMVNVKLDIPEFGLAELMSLLPSEGKWMPRGLSFAGNGRLNASILGSLSNADHLVIRSDFELRRCSAQNTLTGGEVSNINLKGSVSGTRSENFELRVNSFTSDMGNGALRGNFMLHNLKTLLFSAEVHSNLDLVALKEFAGLDTAEFMKGNVRSDFIASGSFRKLADSSYSVFECIQQGTFRFEDAGFKLAGKPWNLQHVTGMTVWDKNLQFDSLRMQLNGMDLLVNGSLQNLSDYLLKQGLLNADLEIRTDHIDLNNILLSKTRKRSGINSGGIQVFPANIRLNARLKTGNFTAGKFEASDVSLTLAAIRDSVFVSNFMLKFPDGSIAGNALITGNTGHGLTVTCNSWPRMINIQELFTAFNNFTQHFIIDKNVRGHVDGAVSFKTQWDSTLKWQPKSLKAQAEIEITNGELVQFEPMLRLSKYINVDELRHIRFSTLKNKIFIDDQLVSMPEMDINSTAFNISVSGQHSFDNVFDYRLKVLLSEVLFNKARKKKKEMDEFMVEETLADRATIPLIIAGTPDNFDVRFDRKRAFELTRKNMRDDDAVIKSKPSPDNFRITWEEEPVKEEKADRPLEKSKASDFVIEWNEEDSTGQE